MNRTSTSEMNGGSVTTNGNENENGSPVKQVMANMRRVMKVEEGPK